MLGYGYDNSLEHEVMSASPARLVQMLYRGALDAVGAARAHLWAGEITERSRQITRAQMILAELTASLDVEKGGDVAWNLGRLYDYMMARLAEANYRQAEEPLADVARILSELAESWEEIDPEREWTPFGAQMAPQASDFICECVG